MNADFVKLVEAEYEKIQNGEPCFYIGEGNPDADILIVGNECAIDDKDPRLSNDCSEDERRKNKERIIAKDNVEGWKNFIDHGYNAEDIRSELNYYKGGRPVNGYYPLFPWFGQKCIVRITDENGNAKRGKEGTARTWVQYQKLIDWIYGRIFDRNNFINFHLYAFHTELSQIPRKQSGKYNKETDDSIRKRMEKLFGNPFFKKFPVVIIAAGHYVKTYKIDNSPNLLTIEKMFDVKHKCNRGDESNWIHWHESSDSRRLLLHTKHFAAAISNDYIRKIAELASPYIERPNKRTMTTNKYPRLCIFSYDFMDVRCFLHYHHRSSLHKIKVAGDNMDSVLTEVRKQMSDIGQISAYIMTIILRDEYSLRINDFFNLSLAITNNRANFEDRLVYIAEDPNAAANFIVSIYAYK